MCSDWPIHLIHLAIGCMLMSVCFAFFFLHRTKPKKKWLACIVQPSSYGCIWEVSQALKKLAGVALSFLSARQTSQVPSQPDNCMLHTNHSLILLLSGNTFLKF